MSGSSVVSRVPLFVYDMNQLMHVPKETVLGLTIGSKHSGSLSFLYCRSSVWLCLRRRTSKQGRRPLAGVITQRPCVNGNRWLTRTCGSPGQPGSLYDYGRGVLQDFKMAAKWYRRSADQGNDLAQRRLGLLYERGDGVPQDHVQA